jgi:hypothetical protein
MGQVLSGADISDAMNSCGALPFSTEVPPAQMAAILSRHLREISKNGL